MLFTLISLLAQGQMSVGVMPTVNVQSKEWNLWKANMKVEGRHLFFDDVLEGIEGPAGLSTVDASIVFSNKVGYNKTIAIGYLSRFRDNRFINRTMQQVIIGGRIGKVDVKHRIAADQTFHPDIHTIYRLRYRIGGGIATQGEKVDPGEFYFKLNNEYLFILEDTVGDIELRLTPFIGYMLNDQHKYEVGVDYRFAAFVHGAYEHDFWLSLNWYLSF